MRFAIAGFDDSSDNLDELLPLNRTIFRQILGPDAASHFLAVPGTEFLWKKETKTTLHRVVGPHGAVGVLSAPMRRTAIDVACVTNDSCVSHPPLDFEKYYYATIGWAHGAAGQSLEERAVPSGLARLKR